MTTRTRAELVAEMQTRFGEDSRDWAFKCPACGDVANGWDFIAACKNKPDRDPNIIGQECIGRTLGACDETYTGRGCDWAAYGLFHGPDFLIIPDGKGGEKKIPCFEIAPAPDVNGEAA